MDFFQIKKRASKKGSVEIYPDFQVIRSNDLMIRGRSVYAIWDEEARLWSTNEYDVQRLVDKELIKYADEIRKHTDDQVIVKLMSDFSSGSWAAFKKYISTLSDNSKQLDTNLTFLNDKIKKKDYVSKTLNYPLQEGPLDAYEELISTLYIPEERDKIEWAIGAVMSGDAKNIQKFIVLYGEQGSGKSTILNIIQKLFHGYYSTFDAKALTSNNNVFATEVFKSNPLVAIQHDGDLSRIEDNTKLNSIVSHEEMTINEKHKPTYTARINSFLFLASNSAVKITDGKSGLIRRLIDVKPSGKKIPAKRYFSLMQQIDFELGAIAFHCLDKYRHMGKNYYNSYKPLEMMFTTDVFFNYVEANYFIFKEQNGVTLKQGYDLYKEYCDDSSIDYKLPKHRFREELKNYFKSYHQRTRVDDEQVRNYYEGFLLDKFENIIEEPEENPHSLVLDSTKSILDDICESYPAQYATRKGTPIDKWVNVKTNLKDLNTKKIHYVKLPINHIVIDFDLTNDKGEKDLEKNLEAASKWPPTYAEFSKSGKGLHLHYIYDGDPETLSRIYSDGIEIKVFVGNASLRRKLSKCNTTPIATINSGLPMKGEKMLNFTSVKNEKGLRTLIIKNLNKEIHPGTKPSIDFIHKILEDAYADGLKYDISDMRPAILTFATKSTNQAEYCIKLVTQMKFHSDEPSELSYESESSGELSFFDVEVFPNLFVVVWKFKGGDKTPVKMINPTAQEIESILKLALIGFNCRRYDNHILYGAYLGYNNEQLFKLSQRLIKNSRNASFREAYNLSYTDIYDFSSLKQSLKKFQLELGLTHKELDLPWDEPVPEDRWDEVADYCVNDVLTTEAVFNARQHDFKARQILARLSGLSVNDTTQNHTARIIFGKDNKPQEKFIYTDLSEMFPDYTFEFGKSDYKGEDPKEGGYVYAEPGMYSNVAVLDITSMHPNSLINMNMFGPYTQRYKELVDARIAIKHHDLKTASKMLGGILIPFLEDEEELDDLAYALKIVINIVYGLTSAKFENKFKDPRNIDNIVAKRGALFMIDLKYAVQKKGFTVAHIKTDSIKIPDATPELMDYIVKFGKKYGYEFEHETTYEKFCLVNDAVFIAKEQDGKWDAVGAQFAHPYVFKTLFSKEPIEFKDLCEMKSVTTALYLDFNENLPEGEHRYHFVGRAGMFCPIEPGFDAGLLMREKDGKYYAATGSKGYRWLEAYMVEQLKKNDIIDHTYFKNLVDGAVQSISKYGDIEWFTE